MKNTNSGIKLNLPQGKGKKVVPNLPGCNNTEIDSVKVTEMFWKGFVGIKKPLVHLLEGFIMFLDPFYTTILPDELVKMKVKMKTEG